MKTSMTVVVRGAAAIVSAVAGSAVVIAHNAGSNGSGDPESREPQDSFDEGKVLSYRRNFDTKAVNAKDPDRPLLDIRRAGCFDAFFPEVELRRPSEVKVRHSDLSSAIPDGFALEGHGQTVGCKLMKMTVATESVAFGYLSETTVQNEKYGLAFYAASSNIKHWTQTHMEYWMLLLEKKLGAGTLHGSYRWEFGVDEDGPKDSSEKVQKPFAVFTPQTKQHWKWSPNPIRRFRNFFYDKYDYKHTLWIPSQDSYFDGLWFMGREGGESTDQLFYEGSNEKWSFKHWFNTEPSNTNVPFLDNIKMSKKGSWNPIAKYCRVLGKENSDAGLEGIKNICFSKSSHLRSVEE